MKMAISILLIFTSLSVNAGGRRYFFLMQESSFPNEQVYSHTVSIVDTFKSRVIECVASYSMKDQSFNPYKVCHSFRAFDIPKFDDATRDDFMAVPQNRNSVSTRPSNMVSGFWMLAPKEDAVYHCVHFRASLQCVMIDFPKDSDETF